MKESLKIYWKLFTSTLIISACTFGGGFVIISLMKKKFVEELHWIGEDEILDLAAIAQSSPGALAVNAAIIMGYRIKKVKGAIVATLGTIIPPIVIISIISLFYTQFKDNKVVNIALQVMRAGVAAVIFDVVINLANNIFKTKSVIYIVLMFATFIASYILKISAIKIILVCGVIGLIMVLADKKHVSDEKGGTKA